MTETTRRHRPRPPPRRSRSPTSRSSTACAASTGTSCAASRSRSRRARPTGSWASRAAASRPRRSAIVRYLPRNGRITAGGISVAGQDVLALGSRELREYRARTVSMVYQNPGSALNPGMQVGTQVAEAFTVLGVGGKEARAKAEDALRLVQIADPASVMGRYPHQLSGGMQQRVVIAMALAKDPTLLILDEPTTGLDATVEAEVLDLVADLQAEFDTAVLFISHNLGVISKMCDRVGVLYAGRLVEEGPVETVLHDPRHPYTVGLLRCMPRGGVRKDRGRLDTIPGFLPSLGASIPGCVFADRCALADERCRTEEPALERDRRRAQRAAASITTRRRACRARCRRTWRCLRSTAAAAPLLKLRRPRQGVPAARQRHPRARRRQRRDLAGRDARARRRVGQREDDARADAARDHRPDVGGGRARRDARSRRATRSARRTTCARSRSSSRTPTRR